MDGTKVVGGSALNTVNDTRWWMGPLFDLNNDGVLDLVWRTETDQPNTIWTLNGITPTGYSTLAAEPDLNWQMAGSSIPQLRKNTDDLIVDIYVDVLGRTPYQTEIAAWRDNLNAGWTFRAMRDSFCNAPEARQAILGVYHEVLHRPAAKWEIDVWQANIKAGWTLPTMAKEFKKSPGAGKPVTYTASDGTTFTYDENLKTGTGSASGTDRAGVVNGLQVDSTRTKDGFATYIKLTQNKTNTYNSMFQFAYDGSFTQISMGGRHEGLEFVQTMGLNVTVGAVSFK